MSSFLHENIFNFILPRQTHKELSADGGSEQLTASEQRQQLSAGGQTVSAARDAVVMT